MNTRNIFFVTRTWLINNFLSSSLFLNEFLSFFYQTQILKNKYNKVLNQNKKKIQTKGIKRKKIKIKG
jgi:hypothetical protein